MTPRLEACCFSSGDANGWWPRLGRVFAFSAARHCPHWDRHLWRGHPERLSSPLGIQSHVHNTQKMDRWFELVTAAPEGAHLALLDADTMILRSLDDVWDRSFDLAYTVKAARFPFNSGVVFLRVRPAVRAFITRWRTENRQLLADPLRHQHWRKKYGGINQAALGLLLEAGAHGELNLLGLPCAEWNCEDSSWASFDPAVARIVHVKGALRRAIFGRPHARPPQELAPLVAIWHELEGEALKAAREVAA